MTAGPRPEERTAFLRDALGAAIELGVTTPDHVLRFMTADILAAKLPRPLWARLLTAALGAARLDAPLVVETVGVPNLCEHLPAPVVWRCIADAAARELGAGALTGAHTGASPHTPSATVGPPLSTATLSTVAGTPPVAISTGPTLPRAQTSPPGMPLAPLAPPPPPSSHTGARAALVPPPPPAPTPMPAPAPSVVDDMPEINVDLDDPIAPPPPPEPVAPAPRASSSSRVPFTRPTAHTTRRPQAQATTAATGSSARRKPTELNDYEVATDVRSADDYRTPGDDQLVEWSSSEETFTSTEEPDRKR